MKKIKTESHTDSRTNIEEVLGRISLGGFTLIELMVVIVIIGILSALAVPKMISISARAKAAEAPSIINNWEKLQSAYAHENSSAGTFASIGFQDPTSESKWFKYEDVGADATTGGIVAVIKIPFEGCSLNDTFVSSFDVLTIVSTHPVPVGTCAVTYAPNFL